MQRKSTAKLSAGLLSAFVVFNLGSTIFLLAAAPLVKFSWFKTAAQIVFVLTFYILVYSAAFRDGCREQNLLKYKHIAYIDKYKWLKIGGIVVFYFALANSVLLLSYLGIITPDLLIPFCLIHGGTYPLALLLMDELVITEMPFYGPFLFLICYAFTPLVGHLAFNFGNKGIDIKNKILYE